MLLTIHVSAETRSHAKEFHQFSILNSNQGRDSFIVEVLLLQRPLHITAHFFNKRHY